jgi:hypothetical protein
MAIWNEKDENVKVSEVRQTIISARFIYKSTTFLV